jgi:hypothetical protein
MIWSTEKINNILEQYKQDKSIKPIVRDITIDHILSNETSEITFPFVIEQITGEILFKSSGLLFEYTDVEIQNFFEIKSEPSKIFEYLEFDPYPFQKEWLEDSQQRRYNLFIRSRQIGTTTVNLISALYYIINNVEKNVVYLCRSVDDSTNKFQKFVSLYKQLPFYLQIGVIDYSSVKIKFENGSSISFYQQNKNNVGFSVDFLIVEDLNLMNQSIINTWLPIVKGSLLVTTLPSSDRSHWINQCLTNNNFSVKYFDWTCIPERGNTWVKNELLATGGISSFINEYCCGKITPETQSILRDIKIDSIL